MKRYGKIICVPISAWGWVCAGIWSADFYRCTWIYTRHVCFFLCGSFQNKSTLLGIKNKYTTRNIYQWNCRTHTKIKILFTLISNVSRFWRRYLDLWFSHSQRISQSRSLWPCQILCLLKSFLQSKYLMSTKCRPGVFFPAGHLPKRTTAWKKKKIKTHYRKQMYDTGLNFCLKCHSILAHCSGKKMTTYIFPS